MARGQPDCGFRGLQRLQDPLKNLLRFLRGKALKPWKKRCRLCASIRICRGLQHLYKGASANRVFMLEIVHVSGGQNAQVRARAWIAARILKGIKSSRF